MSKNLIKSISKIVEESGTHKIAILQIILKLMVKSLFQRDGAKNATMILLQ